MSKPCLTHVALFSADVAASVAFYEGYAGLHVVHDRVDDGVRVAWLSEQEEKPHFVLVVIGKPHGGQTDLPPMAHLGYDLESRLLVDEIGERARRDGILVEPPNDGGPVVGYYCIVSDPDGNFVEFSHGQTIDPARV